MLLVINTLHLARRKTTRKQRIKSKTILITAVSYRILTTFLPLFYPILTAY